MNMNIYKPQAVVSFYTEKGKLVIHSEANSNSSIDGSIVSIHTNRDMGADAPTFSINLTRKQPWHKIVGSNDLVLIAMKRPPETLDLIFIGLVDDTRKRVVIGQDGSIQRVITISGRGLSKAFVEFDIGIVPEAEGQFDKVGWMTAGGIQIAGQYPDVILKSVWKTLGEEHINYEWSNNLKLFDVAKHRFSSRPNMRLLDETGLVNWQGSLWSFMREISENPFYELFWEIYENTPYLISRPTPFSKQNWGKLECYHITDEDVVIDETGKSDIETYSLFSVGMKCMFARGDAYQTTGLKPLWNEDYAKKYGLRRLHVPSSYIAVADSSDITETDVMRELQVDLYNWNIKNNSMYNGFFVVKGSNRYKIGNRIRYTSEEDNSDMTYYIRSVSHKFTNFGAWTVQLGVTRGLDEKDRFTPPYDVITEYTSIGFTPFNPFSTDMSGLLIDSQKATAVVNGAIALMNANKVRYVFGGRGIEAGEADCSQFTQYIYLKYAGVDIGRTTGTQVTKGTPIKNQADLSPGDLIFFKNTYSSNYAMGVSHVGIYIGNGQFIHNSSGAGKITTSNLSGSYYQQHWLMGRRVLQVGGVGGFRGSATNFDRILGGVLKGQGVSLIASSKKYGVDPYLATAIIMHETGNGTSDACVNKNNVGGMMGKGGLMRFRTLAEGIDAMIRNLKHTYIDCGLTTIPQIQRKYAPIGASNDPGGLNKDWVNGVTYFYNKLKSVK